MANPRVVIVDDDKSYIIPLQTKLAEEYLGTIDFEFITNEDYYADFFSVPQKIDVLLISDKYYSLQLQRHSIKKIIWLTEEENEQTPIPENTEKVFKYINVREIISLLNSREIGLFHDCVQDNSTKIILVTSAIGGVGKTTISMGLCAILEKKHKKVLYISAEYLQTFSFWFCDRSPISNQKIDVERNYEVEQAFLAVKSEIRKEKFDYLPAFKTSILSQGISFSLYNQIIAGAKNSRDYDYVIVDTDSVFNKEKVELIGMADQVIVVTDQIENSIFATKEWMRHISDVHSEKYIFVCNKYDGQYDKVLRDKYFEVVNVFSEYIEKLESETIRLENVGEICGMERIAKLFV